MWQIDTEWWQVIARAACVYAFIFVLFRFFGKKQLGEMSPFDFVLLLIVSESVSNGLGGHESSVTGAFLSVSTLVVLSYLVDLVAFKSRRFERILEGDAQIIISNGKIREGVRQREKITLEELKSALRREGIDDIKDVKHAILETSGEITVIKK